MSPVTQAHRRDGRGEERLYGTHRIYPEFTSIKVAKLFAGILERMTGERVGIESVHEHKHRVLRANGDHWETA